MLRTSLFTLIFTSILWINASGQKEWKNFIPIDGSFKILFPNQPDLRSKELNTELGMLKSQSYSVKGAKEDPNFLYSVNVVYYKIISFD
ncbi:MAG: hypothetical protein RLZZ546_217 [Bacteroidota bacterium]